MGIGQGALDIAIKHTQNRVQFGKPLAHLAPIQFMIADMATAVECSRLLTRKAAQLVDEHDKKAVLYGSMAKTMASDTAVVGVHAAEQHRAEHRAVRDAEPGGQDVDALAPQFDGIRVSSLPAPDPRVRAPFDTRPQVPQQPAHCAQGTATAASTC